MDALSLALTFVVAAVGAYLGSYLKRKGENLATHEDIGKLTQVTKEIEAKISIDLWSRQQRWEVQKSALLDSLKELASAEPLLFAMAWAYLPKNRQTDEGKQHLAQANENYDKAINAFWRTQLATEIVCGKPIADQFEKINRLFASVRIKAREGKYTEVWDEQFTEIKAARTELVDLIRKELEFDLHLTPRSTGSSAAPSLDA